MVNLTNPKTYLTLGKDHTYYNMFANLTNKLNNQDLDFVSLNSFIYRNFIN